MVFKTKIRKIAKIYYVLKATNGETQARIKKMIEKRKRTTTLPPVELIVLQLQEAKLC